MLWNNNSTVNVNGVVDVCYNRRTCHGCSGRGWVETSRGAERCPVCLGSGLYPPLPAKLEIICEVTNTWV